MAYTEKYVRNDAGGSGDGSANTPSAAWTIQQAVAGYAPGDRINVIEGSYGPFGEHVIFSTAATPFECIEWRGRNLVDTGPAMPEIDVGTYTFRVNAGGIFFRDFDVRGSVSTYLGYLTAASSFFYHCSFYNSTTTSSGSGTAMFGQTAGTFVDCFFQTDATTDYADASYVGALHLNRGVVWGCKAKAKYPYHFSTQYSGVTVRNNIGIGTGAGFGILLEGNATSTPAPNVYANNTLYNNIHGFFFKDLPTTVINGTLTIRDNLFHTCSGYALYSPQAEDENFYGTTTNIMRNGYYNCSNGYLGGFDYNSQTIANPLEDPIQCTADPCVDAGNEDFSLNSNPNGGLLLKKAATNPVYDWSL